MPRRIAMTTTCPSIPRSSPLPRRDAVPARDAAVPAPVRRTAFTLIELLIVIGIITLLISIALYGFGVVGGSMKGKITGAQLDNSRNLLQTFTDTTTIDKLLPTPPVATGHWAAGANATSDNAKSCVVSALNAPLLLQDTARVVARLRSVPSNRASLEKMSTDRVRAQGYNALTVTYNDQDGVAQTATLPASTADQPSLVLLDGTGQPIYFVPGGGLANVNVGYHGNNADRTLATSYDQVNQIIRSPEHLPFWVSPGPDGDLTTGDDNVYSFNQ